MDAGNGWDILGALVITLRDGILPFVPTLLRPFARRPAHPPSWSVIPIRKTPIAR